MAETMSRRPEKMITFSPLLFIPFTSSRTFSNLFHLNGALTNALKSLTRHFKSDYVFCKPNGSPYKDIKEPFRKACREAGIEDFVFHDFRHTAITNWRRAGIDHLTIMKISGHKTMAVFK